MAGAIVRDRWAPLDDLAGFRGPAAVLVAGRDEVVGAEQGRRLFASLQGPKRLEEQPEATHNGLDLRPGLPFWAEAVALLTARR
jgi:pimeloyl-ACP methyl ester carboxylesterase